MQQYWIDNRTTGSYTFTIKVAATTGIVLATDARGIFYCDGTELLDADTSTISLPVSIAQGGTGAITAGAALINLGEEVQVYQYFNLQLKQMHGQH